MKRQKGFITVEACMVVPLFLFFMLAMASVIMLLLAEAHIHQSLVEAAGYTAQYAYLEEQLGKKNKKVSLPDSAKQKSSHIGNKIINYTILSTHFQEYLGEDFYVEKMVCGGKKGIIITAKQDTDNPKIYLIEARYYGRLMVPMFQSMQIPLKNRVKQKAFVGYSKEEQETDIYVYITPEQSVYHTKRSCTHLSLSVYSASEHQKVNCVPCGFCGRKKRDTKGTIYLTRTTNVYHNNQSCSGLKRSVKRVKKSEVGGLGPCTRCGD